MRANSWRKYQFICSFGDNVVWGLCVVTRGCDWSFPYLWWEHFLPGYAREVFVHKT